MKWRTKDEHGWRFTIKERITGALRNSHNTTINAGFFHFNHIVAKRNVCISLFCEHSGRTNDIDTKGYATFLYDTVKRA